MTNSEEHWLGPFRQPLLTAVYMVALLILLHVLRLLHVLPYSPADWGLYPRRVFGLHGILTAPLAHSGWKHLLSNAVPLLAMITVIFAFFRRVAWQAFIPVTFEVGVQPLEGVLDPSSRKQYEKACEMADYCGGLPSRDRPEAGVEAEVGELEAAAEALSR